MGAELEGVLCTDKMWRTVVCSTVQVAYHADMIPGARLSPMIPLFLCSGGISTRTFPEQRIRHSRDKMLAQKQTEEKTLSITLHAQSKDSNRHFSAQFRSIEELVEKLRTGCTIALKCDDLVKRDSVSLYYNLGHDNHIVWICLGNRPDRY